MPMLIQHILRHRSLAPTISRVHRAGYLERKLLSMSASSNSTDVFKKPEECDKMASFSSQGTGSKHDGSDDRNTHPQMRVEEDRPSSAPPKSVEESDVEKYATRRGRPPLSYTDDFHTPSTISLETIGVVRSPYKERFGTPRQPNVTENTLGNKAQPAQIHLFKDQTKADLSLRGLSEFEYCWVITFFHLNQGFSPLVKPPRGPRKRQGVFATRSPHRPNSIGLSCIRLTGVDETKGIIDLLGVDLLDGTPVLDIKPYVPYCDAFPDARAGWLDRLDEDMKAPDKLNYYPPPAHLMRPIDTVGSNSEDDGSDKTPQST